VPPLGGAPTIDFFKINSETSCHQRDFPLTSFKNNKETLRKSIMVAPPGRSSPWEEPPEE